MLATGLLVVHNTSRGGQDNVAELTSGQQLDDPLLEISETDVVSGRDDTSLVETAVELNDDLAGAMVVDLLELANVAVTLHDLEELDDDLGARSDQDLTLASLLGIVDGVESIVENGSADHFGGVVGTEILKSNLEMRYLPMGENMLASRGREQEECPPEMDQRGFCRSFPKKRSVSRASDDQDSTLFCTASQKEDTLLCPSSPVAELKIALFYHDKEASSSLDPDRCQFLFVPSEQHTSVIYFVGPSWLRGGGSHPPPHDRISLR